jgi:hypothetical protein
LEESLADSPEAAITVRGKDSFVVMKIEHYHQARMIGLEAALYETHQDDHHRKKIIKVMRVVIKRFIKHEIRQVPDYKMLDIKKHHVGKLGNFPRTTH